MKLSEVTLDDGRQCAQLINLIKSGRWDLSGADAEVLISVKRWVQALAGQMASQLDSTKSASPSPAPVPTSGMRVKSMGPLGSSPIKKSKKK